MVALPPKGHIPKIAGDIADVADDLTRAASRPALHTNAANKTVDSAMDVYQEVAPRAGFIGGTMGVVEGAMDRVNSASGLLFPLFIASSAISLLGSGIGFVHKGAGNGVKRAGSWLNTGPNFLLNVNAATIGEKTGMGKFIGRLADRIAASTAPYVDKVARITGIAQRQVRVNGKKAARLFPEAIKNAVNISSKEFQELQKASNAEALIAMGASKAEAEAATTMAKHFETLRTEIINSGKTGQLSDAGIAAATSLKRGVVAGASMPSGPTLDAFYKAADKVAHHSSRVKAFGNVEQSVKNAPKALSQAAIGHNVINGAIVGASVLGTFGVAKSLKEHLTALKHMYADLTGADENKVSLMKVMLGKVPAPVAEARSHLIKNFGLQGGMQTVGLLIGIKQFKGHRISGKAMAGQMALMMGAAPLSAMLGESVLPAYEGFHKAHKSGKLIPLQYYAEFVGTASAKLRNNGGAQNPFAAEVARQYAEEKAGPKQIMDEIANGALDKRLEKIAAANDAASKAKAAPAAAPETEKQPMPMVDKLNGKADSLAVMGKYTGEEQMRRSMSGELAK